MKGATLGQPNHEAHPFILVKPLDKNRNYSKDINKTSNGLLGVTIKDQAGYRNIKGEFKELLKRSSMKITQVSQ